MRAFAQCSLALVSFAAFLSGRVLAETLAQPPEETLAEHPEDIEEIIVRGGKTLSQYRLELEQAQDELFKRFNEANQGNDTDVRCRDEVPTGSRIPQRVRWSRAQDRATAKGARNFLTALTFGAGSASEGGETGLGAMQSVERDGERAALQFEDEWRRLLGGDPRFAEAVGEYAALKEEFDRISGATIAYAQQPRQILLEERGRSAKRAH